MADKKKQERFTTPPGIAKFIAVQEPSTKFNPLGDYNVTLLLSPDDAKELTEKIDEWTDAHYNEVHNSLKAKDKAKLVKAYPYEEDYDKDENATGFIALRFKRHAKVVSAKNGKTYEFQVHVFDKYGKPVPPTQQVRWGSIVQVNFTPVPYTVGVEKCGISLQLNAVKVDEFSEGGQSAVSYGFDVEPTPVPDEDYDTSAVPPSGDF